MSKYTTEVRYVCEVAAGYRDSVGYSEVDNVLAKSWNKIFTNFPIYDEKYRSVLCQKILKHYYTREIGYETVGLWKLGMNTMMNEIMPYYNQLYMSTLIEFNPMYDVDVKTTGNRNTDYDEKTTGKNDSNFNRTDTSTQESDNLTYNLFSDTPQGGLNGVDNETYLSDARKVTDHVVIENNGNQVNDGSETSSGSKVFNNVDDYAESVLGKRGGQSYSSMLKEFRETFLNIDMMIINDLSTQFLGLL